MKKILIVPLAATLLFVPQTETRADCGDFWAGVATIGAAAIGASIIGGAIYHACKPYPHSKEIEFGNDLLCKACSLYDQCTALESPRTALSYLNSTISDIDNIEQKIDKKITHLKKRQGELYRKRKRSSYNSTYYDQYEQLCINLRNIKINLQRSHTNLQTIRHIVRAKKILADALGYYDKYANRYATALDLFAGYNPEFATNHQLSTLVLIITQSASSYEKLPFIKYLSGINSATSTIDNTINRIGNRVAKLSLCERNLFYREREQIRAHLGAIRIKLQTLCANLKTIARAVKSLREYRDDIREQTRIEEERIRREMEEARIQQEQERIRLERERQRMERERRREEERRRREQLRRLEKQIRDLRYELNNRPHYCDECYIRNLENQIRDLERQRDSLYRNNVCQQIGAIVDAFIN